MLQPERARLFEHDSRGPGAHRSPTRRQLGNDPLVQFTRERMLAGWLPQP